MMRPQRLVKMADRGMGAPAELIAPLGLGAVGGGFLVTATAYFTAENLGLGGSTGVLGVACTAGSVAGVAVLSKLSRRNAERRAEAEQQAAWDAWLAEFPSSVQHVVEILCDPWSACAMWTALGLGREPNPARNEPGAWPQLEPSHGSFPPDEGVWPVPVGARIRLRMLTGHEPKQYAARVEQLAVALNAQAVRVVEHQGRYICLDVRTRDPLKHAIPVPIPAEPVDLTALNPGLREDGEHWLVPLLERNWLGVGVPGAGKSGFVHSALVATAPAARDGSVVNIMIDLKFGVEAAKARGLLHHTATSEQAAEDVLRWLRWELVEKRGRDMEARGIDKHVPTPDAPAYHLIIDELAELLDNPETRKLFLRLLISIMRLGRALGFSVSAYTQLGNKAILGMLRDLFQIRIGMRMTSPEQVVMTYGDHHAIERGAANTTIPDKDTPGIAYVVDDSSSQIVRVRAYYVTPDDLARFARMYPPFPHQVTEQIEQYAGGGGAGSRSAEVVSMPERKRETPALPSSAMPASILAFHNPAGDRDEAVAAGDDDALDEAFAEADALSDAIGEALAAED
ncbi:FtsK/SpoIIIE domain-containing protein [Nocardia amamiensis]|uniref:FtsK/SpoIIIE domain-containing protein n=1 Tax=Nocardia amamiensis TaxID=404578 RepID=UPI000830D239|nr:FtsK/SpoIIIE domain-containing protein [Nocardia amamiensis]